MLRVGGKTIALAKSCNVDLTANTIDARVLSDAAPNKIVDSIAFSLTSDSIIGVNNGVSQQTFATLSEMMHAKEPVDVEFFLSANCWLALPTNDWQTGPQRSKGFAPYAGKALITRLSARGETQGYATMNITLEGVGELQPSDSAVLRARVEGTTLYLDGAVEVLNGAVVADGDIKVENGNLIINDGTANS